MSELPPYPYENVPIYTGPHPGTGSNDHIHMWHWYRLGNDRIPPNNLLIVACEICGITKRETLHDTSHDT